MNHVKNVQLFHRNWRLVARVQKTLQTDPPHIQVQNEQYIWLSSSSIWENIKRGGVNQRRNAGFFQIFMSYFQTFYRCCFVVFLHFFSVLKLIFKIFFDRFSGNFRLSRQDEGVFSHLSKKKIKNFLIRPRNDFSKIAIFSPFSFKETKGNLFRS